MKRDIQPVSVAVRAVDVGYFAVKYTKGRKQHGDASTIDVGLFPSLAPQVARADFGGTAAPQAVVCPVTVGGVTYAVGPGSVYHASGSEPRPVDADYAGTEKYHALALGALHYMAEDAGAGRGRRPRRGLSAALQPGEPCPHRRRAAGGRTHGRGAEILRLRRRRDPGAA